jgi:hypothetical protein
VSQAAATLALSKDEPKRQQASDTLYTLSLGPLRIVEQTGDKIGPAITAFESCLESKCATLVTLASTIAENCRDEIATSGQIELFRGKKASTAQAK